MNFSMVAYFEMSATLVSIAVEVKHGCLDRMALITAIGDSVNRMIPPLIVTKKQIDELMLIMRASIEDAAAKY